MARKESKTVHEAFSRFFENPTRESFRSLLKEHVGEGDWRDVVQYRE